MKNEINALLLMTILIVLLMLDREAHTGSVLGPLLFVLFKANMWSNISCRMISYADIFLLASISRPNLRPSVTACLNNDLELVNSWCNQ